MLLKSLGGCLSWLLKKKHKRSPTGRMTLKERGKKIPTQGGGFDVQRV